MTATASAQDYGQTATLKIWDNTTAPHSNGITTPETEKEPNRVRNTSEATLYIFPADPAKATGQAVVICPGGGYVKLCIDYEGYDMAKWFAANGITGAVLKYRMPNHHPEVPLEDAVQALRIMAGLEAGATGYTADKVGIVGSSAGGHLAAMASTIGSFKPAFSVLFYPVITAVQGKRHQGSFINLLNEQRTPEQDAAYSLESRVTADRHPAALGRRQDRSARQQHALLQRPEGARHRSLDAHLPLGRPRLGHPRLVPLQGPVAGRRAGLAPPDQRISRPGTNRAPAAAHRNEPERTGRPPGDYIPEGIPHEGFPPSVSPARALPSAGYFPSFLAKERRSRERAAAAFA